MHSQNKRLCIFGDSHFACVKLAFEQGDVDTTGVDVEFWGNIGKQFKHLTWRNEQIEPLDEFTESRFAKTNTLGRTFLRTSDFDMILFMGCRIDVHRLFPEALYRRLTPSMRLSTGVEARWFGDFLRRQPPYHFARNFAAQNAARIICAPIPFDTAGFEPRYPRDFATAGDADVAVRHAVWDVVDDCMNEDGIELLRQPEETVVSGCHTDPAYAVRNYTERDDRTHKNTAYGALILSAVIGMLREGTEL